MYKGGTLLHALCGKLVEEGFYGWIMRGRGSCAGANDFIKFGGRNLIKWADSGMMVDGLILGLLRTRW